LGALDGFKFDEPKPSPIGINSTIGLLQISKTNLNDGATRLKDSKELLGGDLLCWE
jgi:hypothetical protein